MPYEIKNSKAHPDFILGVSLIILIFIYGTNKLSKVPSDQIEIRTLLIQGGINQDEKWNPSTAQEIYKRYWDMTTPYLQLENVNFDLVVWPESSLPYSLYDQETQKYLNKILSINNFELALGINERVPQKGIYNSIVTLKNNTENPNIYRKHTLFRLANTFPLENRFRLLKR